MSPELRDLLRHEAKMLETEGLWRTAEFVRGWAGGERTILGFRVSFLWGVFVGALAVLAVQVWASTLAPL